MAPRKWTQEQLDESLRKRLLENSIRDESSGCLVWQRYTDKGGYGQIGFGHQKAILAHRASYLVFVGPIPDGLVIDHVKDRGCISRACVEPTHLEAITQGENVVRAKEEIDAHRQRNTDLTHCRKRNHELTDSNVLFDAKGTQRCRECKRIDYREWYAKTYANRTPASTATQLRGSVCAQGHPHTPESVYEKNGYKFCKICQREASKRWRAKRKETPNG